MARSLSHWPNIPYCRNTDPWINPLLMSPASSTLTPTTTMPSRIQHICSWARRVTLSPWQHRSWFVKAPASRRDISRSDNSSSSTTRPWAAQEPFPYSSNWQSAQACSSVNFLDQISSIAVLIFLHQANEKQSKQLRTCMGTQCWQGRQMAKACRCKLHGTTPALSFRGKQTC